MVGQEPTRVLIPEKVRASLFRGCDEAYPNEFGFVPLGHINKETILLEDIIPYENVSKSPRKSFVWTHDITRHAEYIAKVKGLTFLGIGHSHPSPTLPSHPDIRIAQRMAVLQIWVLHKPDVHEIRASWGIHDIRVVYESKNYPSDSFDELVVVRPNVRLHIQEMLTLCKRLQKFKDTPGDGSLIFSDIKSAFGSDYQAKRYIQKMLCLDLMKKKEWNGPPRNLNGRKPKDSYALTQRSLALISSVSEFSLKVKSIVNEEPSD